MGFREVKTVSDLDGNILSEEWSESSSGVPVKKYVFLNVSFIGFIFGLLLLWGFVELCEREDSTIKDQADKLLKLHPELQESYDIYFIDGKFTYYEVDKMVKELGR